MSKEKEEDNVTRKAILTASIRRNAEYHPEFLDTESLLERFEPLLKSIHKKFCSYNGMFDQPDDVSDLYSQIVLEFLRLRQNYDPRRGVDFPGYIKFHLQQRIYHYVTRKQKLINLEQPVKSHYDDNKDKLLQLENLPELIDEETEFELEKVECIASIPWDQITDKSQEKLIRDILIEGKNINIIAKEERVSMKSIKLRLEECCETLINLYNTNNKEDLK